MNSGEKASVLLGLASLAIGLSAAIDPALWPSLLGPKQVQEPRQNPNTPEGTPLEQETELTATPASFVEDNVSGGDEDNIEPAAEDNVPSIPHPVPIPENGDLQNPLPDVREIDDRALKRNGHNLAMQVGDEIAYGTPKNHQIVTDKLDRRKVERWMDADGEQITVVVQKTGKLKIRDAAVVAADGIIYTRHDENGKEQWSVTKRTDGTVISDKELDARGNLNETIPQSLQQQAAQTNAKKEVGSPGLTN